MTSEHHKTRNGKQNCWLLPVDLQVCFLELRRTGWPSWDSWQLHLQECSIVNVIPATMQPSPSTVRGRTGHQGTSSNSRIATSFMGYHRTRAAYPTIPVVDGEISRMCVCLLQSIAANALEYSEVPLFAVMLELTRNWKSYKEKSTFLWYLFYEILGFYSD
jgi:hypothetical protein